MKTALSHVLLGLRAAFRLSVGEADLVPQLPNTMPAAAFSFWSLLVCLPPLVLLRGMEWMTEWPAHPRRAAVVDLLIYVVSWLGFAVLSRMLAEKLECAARWPRFILLWNWCNLVQYLLMLVASTPALLAGPDWWPAQTIALVGQFWALWIELLAARFALQADTLRSSAFVAMDVLMGLILAAIGGWMS